MPLHGVFTRGILSLEVLCEDGHLLGRVLFSKCSLATRQRRVYVFVFFVKAAVGDMLNVTSPTCCYCFFPCVRSYAWGVVHRARYRDQLSFLEPIVAILLIYRSLPFSGLFLFFGLQWFAGKPEVWQDQSSIECMGLQFSRIETHDILLLLR